MPAKKQKTSGSVAALLSTNRVRIAGAFNEWLDEYERNPERFEIELVTLRRHLAERTLGREPTYGELCVAKLISLLEDE